MTQVIAHRGASAAAPENTVEAFHLARKLGADGVELDARRTGDGAVMVHHDAHLPDGRLVVELGADDLPPGVCSLAEALDACAGFAVVNIEVKNWPEEPDFDAGEAVAEAVVAEVQRRAMTSTALVSSFHPGTIDRVRQLDPSLPTAQLVMTMGDPLATLDAVIAGGHDAVNPWDGWVSAEFMAAAHHRGLAVNAWTIDDPVRMAELVALGVDGIVTNVPDRARAVIDATT